MERRNEGNVAALMQAIADSAERMDYISVFPDHFKEPRGTDIERLAEHLARRGVLVPSALTDVEAEGMTKAGMFPSDDVRFDAALFRTALERIAKGETR